MVHDLKFEKLIRGIPEAEFSYFIPKHLKFSDEDIRTTTFLFWFLYEAEFLLKEIAYRAMTDHRNGDDKQEVVQLIDDVFTELTFKGKINLIKKNIERDGEEKKKFKKLFGILEEHNMIRNQLFHTRVHISQLIYKNMKIMERETQNLMIIDFSDGLSGND